MKELMKRCEANPKYCWNMRDMFESDEVWEEEFIQVSDIVPKMEEYRGVLECDTVCADKLAQLLDFSSELDLRVERLYVYASQRSHEDMADSRHQDMAARAEMLAIKKEELSSYIDPQILAIGKDTIEEWCKESGRLAFYSRYFEILFRNSEHILDADTEQLLAGVRELAEGPGDIFAMFNNADIKFPVIKDEDGKEIQITHGRYNQLLKSRERRVRREAFEALYETFANHRNMLASTYRANVKQHAFFARTRKYESGMAYSLSGSNIPVSVYERLIESTREHLPLLHRYVALRKKELDLDELHMYDMYVPMVHDVDMDIEYDNARNIVKEGLAPLGREYQELLEQGYNNGWIDVYENEGKRSGAYSWGAYGTHPYVLLNYQNNLNDVFTLAHEMGHALHSYYSDEAQPYIYAGYKIFVAEVASTCNESLLVHYLIEKAEDVNEKKYLINYFLEQFRTTFFRQTMFAEFEKITHEMCMKGETLTADVMCDIYKKLNEDYFGPDAYIDEQIALEWARIPHFYTPFYVYQYATGFAAAIAISTAILAGDEEVLEGYRKFLKGGASRDPIDLLRLCGVDMTTTEPVNKALEVFEGLIDRFESL